MADPEYDAYRQADAADRLAAAHIAASLSSQLTGFTTRADAVYAWLRARPTVAPHRLVITPSGTPQPKPPEGAPMTTPAPGLSITDQQTDTLTVSAVDALGQPTADTGPFVFTNDTPAVATLTDNGDGTATVAAVAVGSANIGCSDANGIQATPLAVTVTAGPAASLMITPGTPTPERPDMLNNGASVNYGGGSASISGTSTEPFIFRLVWRGRTAICA